MHEVGEQGGLAGEESIEGRAGHLGLCRKVVHREGAQAMRADQGQGGLEDALAGAGLRLEVERAEQRLASLEGAIESCPGDSCGRGQLAHCGASSVGEQASGLTEDPLPDRNHRGTRLDWTSRLVKYQGLSKSGISVRRIGV